MHWYRKNFSRLFIFELFAAAALLLMLSCGSGSDSTNTSTNNNLSKFKHRVFAVESFFGRVVIVNSDDDTAWPVPISIADTANQLLVSPDKVNTYIFASTITRLTRIVNSTETLDSFTIGVPAGINSLAILSDNKTGVAALRNVNVPGQAIGAVLLLDLTNQNISATIPVPEARRIVANHAGNKVLAFADDTNSFYVIDTSAKTATAITDATKLSRPVAAVFSSDDSKAYILNCGAECGGGTPSVTILNAADNTLGASIPVSGATAALLDSNKLYVAGSPNGVGQLDIIDAGTFTRTQTGIAISNGLHNVMALADGGNLYIGSTNCSNVGGGCLSIFPTSGQTATISSITGDVASILPITGRNTVYATINGQFVIFDTRTGAPAANIQPIEVVGNVTALAKID